ncbi:MAG: hypothetical protein QM445_06520 [Thermotogota bacterium]|nr:hypothetical protein [Thermotogota bacterium]
MKKVLVILAIVAMLLSAGCVVKNFPDISGKWEVAAYAEGKMIDFEMLIVPDGYTFDATATAGVTVFNGRLSKSGNINFMLTADGRDYAFYGTVAEDYMTGFIRLGVAGDVVGNWSAER